MNKAGGSIRGSILLFITAFIWGTAFVAQSVGTEFVGPFTFNMSRALLGGIFLIPVIAVIDARKKKALKESTGTEALDKKDIKSDRKTLVTGGICCGVCLCAASALQQIGIKYTTVGKAGFVTAMYIIIVPVISIFLKKKAGVKLWISVVIAVAGLYFLCMNESMSIQIGDILVMLCALAFSVHILVIDYFSPKTDGVKLSCIQFWVMAAISCVFVIIFEKPDFSTILNAWMPICYAGIMSSGVGYTLQIVGQKDLDPTIASLIMSLESVIAVIAGWALLHQSMGGREIFGCVLMFIAIILAQLPEKRKNA